MPATSGSTLNRISVTLTELVPAGTIFEYAGAITPSGWLLCYGQAVSRTTYEALYNNIGTTYGIGDGLTTFNLPDLRGRVIAGRDNMGGVAANRITLAGAGFNGTQAGAAGGSQTHQITAAQMPSHNHGGGNHTHLMTSGGGGWVTGAAGFSAQNILLTSPTGGWIGAGGNIFTGAAGTINSTDGADAAHQNTQPTMIMNCIIKY